MLTDKELLILCDVRDSLSNDRQRVLFNQLLFEYDQYKKCGTPDDCQQRKEWMRMPFEDIRDNFNDIVKGLQNEVKQIKEEAAKQVTAKQGIKIGKRVYCLYENGILVDTVRYLGKDSFILKSFGGPVDESSLEWLYEDYNVTWFTNLSKAKQALIERQNCGGDGCKPKIVKVSDCWYEFEEV